MKRAAWPMWGAIGLVSLAGGGALYWSLNLYPPLIRGSQLMVLGLAVVLQLIKVDLFTYQQKVPGTAATSERRSLTAGLAGTFLVMGYYGVSLAVVAALLQAVISALVNRSAWFKAVFNVGVFTTATFLSGLVYTKLGSLSGAWDLLAVMATVTAVSLYFLVQTTCIAMVISATTDRPFRRVWSDSFSWMVVQQAIIGIIGLLLGRFMQGDMTFVGGMLLLSPLMLLRYSYKAFADRIQAYVGQIERANTDLASLNAELRATNDELIRTLGFILDARDRYTYGHSAQVATYAVALGEKLHLTEQELEHLRQAALLHDIGKVAIPEAVLFKPGKLDEQERAIMQAHAEIGYRITAQVHSLSHVADIIRQHHEWYAGGGYPRNLKGDQIMPSARIISVADALDTLISDRPYRKGKPVEVAFQEIRRWSGTQFDPVVVEALEQLIRERGGLWFQNSAQQVDQNALALEVAASMAVDGRMA